MSVGKKCGIPGCVNTTLQNKRYCPSHETISSTLNVVCENSCDLLLKSLNTLNDEILKQSFTKVSPYMQVVAGSLRHLIVGIIDDARFFDNSSNGSTSLHANGSPGSASLVSNGVNSLATLQAPAASTSVISHSLHRDIMDFSKSMTQLNGASTDLSLKKGNAKPNARDTGDYDADLPPIVDLIVVNSKREEHVPAGYTLISKAFCGRNADLNTGAGGRDVYLAYKRSPPAPPISLLSNDVRLKSPDPEDICPLTSLNVFYADISEEPNFGFAVVKNSEGTQANLNLGTNATRTIFLSSHRGGTPPDYASYNMLFNPEVTPDTSPAGLHAMVESLRKQNRLEKLGSRVKPLSGPRGFGAPIVDIAVLFSGGKVPPKVDWHEVKYTSFGHHASLNAGNDNGAQSQLFFRVGLQPILDTVYKPLLDTIPESFTPAQFSSTRAYIRTCAIVTACLYSTNEAIALKALQAFSRIGRDERALSQRIDRLDPTKKVLPAALNALLQCVCDAVPLFLSCYTTTYLGKILLWLRSMVLLNASTLSIHTFLRVLDVCFLLRHEDRSNGVSHDILRILAKRATDAVQVESNASVLALNTSNNNMQTNTNSKTNSLTVVTTASGHTSPHSAALSASSVSPAGAPSVSTLTSWNSPITTTRRSSMEMGIFSSGVVRVNGGVDTGIAYTASSHGVGEVTHDMTIKEGEESSYDKYTGSTEGFGSNSPASSPSDSSSGPPAYLKTPSNALLSSMAPLTGSLSNIAVNFLSNPYDMCASIVRHIADTVVESAQTNGDLGAFLGSKFDSNILSDITVVSQRAVSSFCPRNWVLSPPMGYNVNPILLNTPRYVNDPEVLLGSSLSPSASTGSHHDSVHIRGSSATGEDFSVALGRDPHADTSVSTSPPATQSSFLSLKNALIMRKNKNATATTSGSGTPNLLNSLSGSSTTSSSHGVSVRSPQHASRLSTGLLGSSLPLSGSGGPVNSPSPMLLGGTGPRGEIDTTVYTTWTRVFHSSPDLCADGVTPYEWKFTKFINPTLRSESVKEHNLRGKNMRNAKKESAASDRAKIDDNFAVQTVIRRRIADVFSHSYAELHNHIRATLLTQQSQKGTLAQLASSQHHQSYEEMTLISSLLFLCKMATLPNPTEFARLEFYKRKVHALGLIGSLLKSGNKFFTVSPTYMAIIQRFVFPCLLSCVELPVHSVFRSVLDVFIILWQNYYSMLTSELGIFVDSVLLRMLSSPTVLITFKRDILEMLDLLVSSPFALVNLFYCYDCSFGAFSPSLRPPTLSSIEAGAIKYGTSFGAITDEGSRIHLFERLVTVVGAIAEGDNRLFQSPPAFALSALASSNSATEQAIQSLRKLALRMLVQFTFNLAQWGGVPCVARSSDVRSALRSTCSIFSDFIETSSEVPVSKEEWKLMMCNVERSIVLGSNSTQPPVQKAGILEEFIRVDVQNLIGNMPIAEYRSLLAESRVAFDREKARLEASRLAQTPSPVLSSTVSTGSSSQASSVSSGASLASSHRSITSKPLPSPGTSLHAIYDQNRRAALERSEVRTQAVRITQERNLTHALKFLRSVSPKLVSPDVVADFIYYTEGLNQADVGDLLANAESDKLYSSSDYEWLRHYFVLNLDFTGLTIIDALRYYTTHCRFRLPGEAQKVDRMLSIFCDAYCRDNPTIFSTPDVAHTVCFMLMILNTDLHNPRLKEESSSGQAYKHMTFTQFCGYLRDCDNGKPLDPVFLAELYHGISARGIVWINDDVVGAHDGDVFEDPDLVSFSNVQAFTPRAEPFVLVRRACAMIRATGPCSIVSNLVRDASGIKLTTSTQFVKPMWELVWFHTYRALSNRADSIASFSPTSDGSSSGSYSAASAGTSGAGATSSALVVASDLAHETEVDIDSLNMCVDGAAYGAAISILLGLGRQRDYFTRILAKLRYMEQRREELSALRVSGSSSAEGKLSRGQIDSDIVKMLAENEHLKQPWLQELRSLAESNAVAACKSVLSNSCATKNSITAQRKLQVLRKLQTGFGAGAEISILPLSSTMAFYVEADRGTSVIGDGLFKGIPSSSYSLSSTKPSTSSTNRSLSTTPFSANDTEFQFAEALGTERMIVPDRTLLKEGKLAKLSSSGKRQEYTFMLFSDILLYATEGTQPHYRAHRVLHLSLIRIDPMRQGARSVGAQTNNIQAGAGNQMVSQSGSQPALGSSATSDVLANAFRIVSPQKSFVVVAPTAGLKTAWINTIVEAIHRVNRLRGRWLDLHLYARQLGVDVLTLDGKNANGSGSAASSSTANTSAGGSGNGPDGSGSTSSSRLEEAPRASEMGRASSMIQTTIVGSPFQPIQTHGSLAENPTPITHSLAAEEEDDQRVSFIESRSVPPPFSGHNRGPSMNIAMMSSSGSAPSANNVASLGLSMGSPTSQLSIGSNPSSLSGFSNIPPSSPLMTSPVLHPSSPHYPTMSPFPIPSTPLPSSSMLGPHGVASPPPVPAHIRLRSIPAANKIQLPVEEVLSKCSSFISHSSYYVNTTPSTASTGSGKHPTLNSASHYCHLCVRPFAMFRRKNKCPCCTLLICAECISKKATVTTTTESSAGANDKSVVKKESVQKVCDACFGYLTGMIGPKLGPIIGSHEEAM